MTQSPTESTESLTAEKVFNDYAPRVYNLARRMLGSDADAEDVTQDVLLQVVRKLGSFRGDSAFTTWLHRVTVNAALAHRRKRAGQERRRADQSLDAVLDQGDTLSASPVKPWSVSPDKAILDEETRKLIEDAIGKLPDSYRDVFVLADIEGLPNAEIASMLGLNLPAIKSRLHRARLMMRDALSPHFSRESS